MQRITREDGKLAWEKANVKDKQGACWTYGWAYSCDPREEYFHHLKRLKGSKFLLTGDFEKKQDPFYTAWCLFALGLGLVKHKTKKKSDGLSIIYYHWLILSSMPHRIWFICKYLWRKITRSQLDKGPVEYW